MLKGEAMQIIESILNSKSAALRFFVSARMLPLILGSSSSARAKVLSSKGIEFTVIKPNIDEKAIGNRLKDSPSDLTLKVALEKAKAVALLAPKHIVVCCDQVVLFQGEIREKPVDREEAAHFLSSYSLEHPAECYTAIVVINTVTGKMASGVDIAKQFFKPIPAGVQEAMILKGEVMHACGGFTIDDDLIKPYLGDLVGTEDSILGLPFEFTMSLINKVI